jgi:hypothetical protein
MHLYFLGPIPLKIFTLNSSSEAELDNASVVNPKEPGSNLSIGIKYFLILFVSRLNSNL